MTIGTGTSADSNLWILDIALSVHLVKDVMLLKNVVSLLTNNTMVRVAKVGSVELRAVVNGIQL